MHNMEGFFSQQNQQSMTLMRILTTGRALEALPSACDRSFCLAQKCFNSLLLSALDIWRAFSEACRSMSS